MLNVGQAMLLSIKKLVEGHASNVKLLADNINKDGKTVFFAFATDSTLIYQTVNCYKHRSALECCPDKQACKIVDDIIFQLKPGFTTKGTGFEPKKTFETEEIVNMELHSILRVP